MSKISLTPNASGTGNFTIASPNSNTDRTLTLPDNTGTILTSASNTNFPAGSVLQVVYASTTSSFSTTSTTLQDTGFSASITPSSSSSKILVISNNSMYVNQNGQGQQYVYCRASLARGSTQLQEQRLASNTGTTAVADVASSLVMTYLDSPATTSSVTYKVYTSSNNASFLTVFSSQGASSLTLIEVKG